MKSKTLSTEREETVRLAREMLESAIKEKVNCVLIIGNEKNDNFKMIGVNANLMEVYDLVVSSLERLETHLEKEMSPNRTLN
jgi:hypothetical protein